MDSICAAGFIYILYKYMRLPLDFGVVRVATSLVYCIVFLLQLLVIWSGGFSMTWLGFFVPLLFLVSFF